MANCGGDTPLARGAQDVVQHVCKLVNGGGHRGLDGRQEDT